ncbi:hypothetical protein [Tanticharoenia sakaeratensis]|jgi:hypothetical protein|nr:hypothetical protein [Tanticharoenia sakaeratensis]GBQ21185.1 hypothetical protein AA103193_1642 [Tanticharoenia sakaeratensis NBRC 103193]
MAQAFSKQECPFDRVESAVISNVVPLRQDVLPRHREYLARWLDAGLRMGLCDADIYSDSRPGCGEVVNHVLVWVRESADPAYLIRPQGMRWVLIDQIRESDLGIYSSFEAALNAIRPVLPIRDIAAA